MWSMLHWVYSVPTSTNTPPTQEINQSVLCDRVAAQWHITVEMVQSAVPDIHREAVKQRSGDDGYTPKHK